MNLGNLAFLESICADFQSMAGGGTVFWVENLEGEVLTPGVRPSVVRVARSGLMWRQRLALTACASGPVANSLVPFFARACQRELDHVARQEELESANGSGSTQSAQAMARAKGGLEARVARVGRDLANVLGTIVGSAELVEASKDNAGEQRRHVERIVASGRTGAQLLERLLGGEDEAFPYVEPASASGGGTRES